MERDIWSWLKRAWDRSEQTGIFSRVEVLDTGWPDIYSLIKGKNSWVELKWAKNVAVRGRALSGHKVSPDQEKWHQSCFAAGGSSFYLIGLAKDLVFLVPGRVTGVNDMTVADIRGVCVLGGSWSSATFDQVISVLGRK